MTKEIRAFFLAPTILLLFPFGLLVYQAVWLKLNPLEAVLFSVLTACGVLTLSYTLMLVVGLPVNYLLQKFTSQRWWVYLSSGVVVGVLVYLAAFAVFSKVMSFSFLLIIVGGVSGAAISGCYWFISVKHITKLST